jgi:hypothetical protein
VLPHLAAVLFGLPQGGSRAVLEGGRLGRLLQRAGSGVLGHHAVMPDLGQQRLGLDRRR